MVADPPRAFRQATAATKYSVRSGKILCLVRATKSPSGRDRLRLKRGHAVHQRNSCDKTCAKRLRCEDTRRFGPCKQETYPNTAGLPLRRSMAERRTLSCRYGKMDVVPVLIECFTGTLALRWPGRHGRSPINRLPDNGRAKHTSRRDCKRAYELSAAARATSRVTENC
jgi:hypothetical protein